MKHGHPVTGGVEVEAFAKVLERTRHSKLDIWADPEMLRSYGRALKASEIGIRNEAEASNNLSSMFRQTYRLKGTNGRNTRPSRKGLCRKMGHWRRLKAGADSGTKS